MEMEGKMWRIHGDLDTDFGARRRRRGVAMIPTLLVVAGLSIFALALLTAGLSAKRTVNHQADDYKLSSSVESVAALATEVLWSGYLNTQGGAAGSIDSFRFYLTGLGIEDSGVGGAPDPKDGVSLLNLSKLPKKDGKFEFNDVVVDTVQVVRRDVGDSTQLYLTVSAQTNRGGGLVNPVLNRAVQLVYTVEPEEFAGFEFAMLANNINCIFCHTNVDSVDRYFNTDPAKWDTFERVKVGSLETLMIRHNLDGNWWFVNDADADSFVAGTVYARGTLTDHDGLPIADFSDLSFLGYRFDDTTGLLIEDAWGDLETTPFVPAGDPPDALENLYLGYPEAYNDMVDGNLPVGFPAPIPDDGGIDPLTGLPDNTGADNKVVDDNEFYAASLKAEGAITAGIITLVPDGQDIDTVAEYAAALTVGNTPSVQQTVDGNLILTGTATNPITIDGTVAVDGDLIINGYVKGEGSLIVRGNVYVPTDLEYLDGKVVLATDDPDNPTGPRTFGVAQDGTKNALGLAAGGNMLIGDYLTPSTLQPDGSSVVPGKFDYVTGDIDDDWTFSLAEMAIFNRAEWAKTQPTLPAFPGQADMDPSTWLMPNPNYAGPDYVPRYYHYGPGDMVPVYNKGDIYYDPVAMTWRGKDTSTFWDPSKVTFSDPDNLGDPILYNPDGTPRAVLSKIAPEAQWIDDSLYKASIEFFEDNRPFGAPMAIDGLLYTNNAIFTLVARSTPMLGRMVLNGSIVSADLGMLVPGHVDWAGLLGNSSPLSVWAIGLQLNYDQRVKKMLNVKNPFQVQLKRTLWNPTANIL